jgi:hypothetical protein
VDDRGGGAPAHRYGVPVRWDALFQDLDGQLAAVEAADRAAAVADLTRAEHATMTLVERLRGAPGPVDLELLDGARVSGMVQDAAADWVLIGDRHGQHLVPSVALAGVTGLGRHALPAASARSDGLGLGHVLRALMRDRRPVQVRTPAGTFAGCIARVGRDHLDVEVRPGDPRGSRAIPYTALLCVSDPEPGIVAR